MALRRPWLLVLAVLLCLAVGAVGTIFTAQSIPTWYAALHKPFFSPPNWLFAPVWTALYVMMGMALYLVQINGTDKVAKMPVALFGVQLFLNMLWSVLFFGFRSPLSGLICIVLLWIAILACIIKFWKISRPASYLLMPYILWVSFATVLNYAIVVLN